jgi:DNA-binding CsgD family transcriptional regulator
MATQTLSNVRKELSVKRIELTVEELIRLLVDSVGPDHNDRSATQLEDDESRCEEILVDVDLEGARYLLVRLPKFDRPQVQLSPREQEIVRMVAQGHSNKIIADVLSISTWTVCTHLRRIFAKAGVGSRAAMVARLLETRGGERKRPTSSSDGAFQPSTRPKKGIGAALVDKLRF